MTPNVGRPKGIAKTGGRKKGVQNKASVQREAAVAASGQTPLEYLLECMRTSADPGERMEAAKAAAPFVHPKLAAVELTGKNGGAIIVQSSPTDDRL